VPINDPARRARLESSIRVLYVESVQPISCSVHRGDHSGAPGAEWRWLVTDRRIFVDATRNSGLVGAEKLMEYVRRRVAAERAREGFAGQGHCTFFFTLRIATQDRCEPHDERVLGLDGSGDARDVNGRRKVGTEDGSESRGGCRFKMARGCLVGARKVGECGFVGGGDRVVDHE
jgi:hypothetical protein